MWTAKEDEKVQKVNELIQSCRPLAMFDLPLPAMVSTDASSCGQGAVLQQQDTQGIRTVSFVSRTLSETERR